MSTTPILDMLEMEASQSQPHLLFNEAIRTLEVLATGSVISATTATPPLSPSDGDAYIIGPGATDDWDTLENSIAWYASGWKFLTPVDGWVMWVSDENQNRIWNAVGGTWDVWPVISVDAYQIAFSNTGSALAATNVQDAIDEIDATLDAQPYDIGANYTGAPTTSFVMLRYKFPRACDFAAGLSPSQGVAAVAATAQTDFDILKNGVSFGTMRFAAAGTAATFIAASPAAFAAGDVLTVVAPASPDATLADIGFVLSGTR